MKKNIFFLGCVLFFSLFFISCFKTEFLVLVEPELLSYFDEIDIKLFEGKKIKLILEPDGEGEKTLEQKNLLGFIFQESHISDELALFEAIGFSQYKTEERKNSFVFTPAILRKELHRNWVYPSISFMEDYPSLEDIFSPRLSKGLKKARETFCWHRLNSFPSDFIALPYGKSYSGDRDYPFYESSFASLSFFTNPSKKKRESERKNSLRLEAEKMAKHIFLSCFEPIEKAAMEEAKSEKEQVLFISAVGDILLSRGVDTLLISSENPASVFTSATPILQNNDITIGNLECVLTKSNKNATKTYTFKADKKALAYLKEAGFNYLMLTNNHSYDFGEEGFKETLAALEAYEIPTSGSGLNQAEAERWYRRRIRGTEVSILSCGAYPIERSGFNGKTMTTATETRAGVLWEGDRILELVREEKKRGGFIIVNVHGGEEYVFSPSKKQKDFYHALCDAGANIVFGSHPHVLQPIETYKDALIVWSLGNFVFPGMSEMYKAEETMIVRLGLVDGKRLYYEKYPCKISGRTVSLVE